MYFQFHFPKTAGGSTYELYYEAAFRIINNILEPDNIDVGFLEKLLLTSPGRTERSHIPDIAVILKLNR